MIFSRSAARIFLRIGTAFLTGLVAGRRLRLDFLAFLGFALRMVPAESSFRNINQYYRAFATPEA
jgi:hypothetical protein